MNILKELIYRLRGEYTTERLIKMGMNVGKNFGRLKGVILDPSHCWLITIGDNVTLAPNVHILCHDASTKYVVGYTEIKPVHIGDNVFVGANSVILPGNSIGNNSIIGANSTVTKPIPENVVAAGNPAKIIMTIDEFKNKKRLLFEKSIKYDESYTLRLNITEEKKCRQRDDLEHGAGFIL